MARRDRERAGSEARRALAAARRYTRRERHRLRRYLGEGSPPRVRLADTAAFGVAAYVPSRRNTIYLDRGVATGFTRPAYEPVISSLRAPEFRRVLSEYGGDEVARLVPGLEIISNNVRNKRARNLARTVVLHELAHTAQRRNLPRRVREGGAEAFTRVMARRLGLLPPRSARSYRRWGRRVSRRRGRRFVLQGQFGR